MRTERSLTIVLINNQTITATSTFAHVVVPERFTAVNVYVKVGTIAATTPSYIFRVQQGMQDITAASDTTIGQSTTGSMDFWDYASFTAITASSAERRMAIVGGSSVEFAHADGSLAGASIRNGPIGAIWRAQVTVTGTSPSLTNCYMIAQFIP